MSLFILIVPILVLGLGFYYIAARLMQPTSLSKRTRRIIWISWYAFAALIFASLLLSRAELPFAGALSWIIYPALGLLNSLFFILLIRDLGWLTVRGGAAVKRLATKEKRSEEEKAVDASRREHLLQLTNIGVLGLAAATTSYGIFEARRTPGIVEVNAPIANLPPEFDGFRIIQLTDLHAGLTVGRGWIETVVEETAKLKGDMIAFTGDLVDGSVNQLRDDVAPLAELQASHGKFFITGNHEYYSGVEDWMKEVGRLGYDVLHNEHRMLQRGGASIVLAGVTDHSGGNHSADHKSDPTKAFKNAPEGATRILLAHQPKALRISNGLHFDLMLAGHTHGGQLFPWNLLTAADQPYLYGMHRDQNRLVYVSKGTGYWGPPVRLGARSEITVITLKKA